MGKRWGKQSTRDAAHLGWMSFTKILHVLWIFYLLCPMISLKPLPRNNKGISAVGHLDPEMKPRASYPTKTMGGLLGSTPPLSSDTKEPSSAFPEHPPNENLKASSSAAGKHRTGRPNKKTRLPSLGRLVNKNNDDDNNSNNADISAAEDARHDVNDNKHKFNDEFSDGPFSSNDEAAPQDQESVAPPSQIAFRGIDVETDEGKLEYFSQFQKPNIFPEDI